jgi:hypothetical protein
MKVTRAFLSFRKNFDHGVSHLKPMVLRQVAEDISMHESTVSRATANKYVHTPQGLFELKFFFQSGLMSRGGDDVASESVKEKIRAIVAAEDPRKPYSDQHIAAMLPMTPSRSPVEPWPNTAKPGEYCRRPSGAILCASRRSESRGDDRHRVSNWFRQDGDDIKPDPRP